MKKSKVLLCVLLVALLAVTYLFVTAAVGDADDPVISLSYLQNVFKPEVLSEAGSGYEAVSLEKGQQIKAVNGSIEVLLRRGEFSAVDPIDEGIANVTSGDEARQGDALVLQNLYVIPRSDGRAIQAESDSTCWVMVKGNYTIE